MVRLCVPKRKPKSREEQLRELHQKRDELRKQLISRLRARDQFHTQSVEKAGKPELAFAKLTRKINELEAQ